MVNIALIFQNMGCGCVAPWTPLTRSKKKNLLSYNPLYIGENSCITYPPHRGFHDKTCENSRIYQHQSARNGIRMHILHPFHQKKNQPGKTPTFQEEKIHSIYIKRWKYFRITYILGVVAKLEKVLISNRQKGLIRHHLDPFFKLFSGRPWHPHT